MKVTITAMLNTISAYWHMVGVGIVVVVLLAVPDEHRSFGSIFTDTVNATGWGGDPAPDSFNSIVFWYVFLTGLLMAQYTITGFDASAHVAEETHKASRSAAVGMYMSVVASVFFGFILLIAVTLALPAEPTIDLYIIPTSWVAAMGQSWGTFLLFICCIAQMFCLTASVTSASRMLFAFSRDRAVPGHQLWRRVAKNRIPHMSVIAIVVASAALMLPTLYNFFIGYYVGTGIAVIGLYIAFILPVILRYRMKDAFEPGAWSLGKHYKWIDPIAIVWVFFISLVFLMPPYSISAPWEDGFTWEAVNYAPILVGGALLLFGGWWVLSANKWFKGPVRMGTEEELQQLEEAQRGQFALPTEAS
jgi:amino acid transporter